MGFIHNFFPSALLTYTHHAPSPTANFLLFSYIASKRIFEVWSHHQRFDHYPPPTIDQCSEVLSGLGQRESHLLHIKYWTNQITSNSDWHKQMLVILPSMLRKVYEVRQLFTNLAAQCSALHHWSIVERNIMLTDIADPELELVESYLQMS